MFKKFLLISIVLFAVVLVSGCNKQEPQVPKQEEKQPVAQENPSQEIKSKETLEEQNEVDEENLVYYKIPELGIKFKIEKELADELIYYIEVAPDDSRFKYTRLSSKELSKLNEYCQVEYGPMGTLVRVEGFPSDYDEPLKNIQRKNFYDGGDFFVYFSSSQTPCMNQEEMESHKGKDFSSLFTNVLRNIQNLEKIED